MAIPAKDEKRAITGGVSRLLHVGSSKNIVKFDYNKDNRPPLRMRYNLVQKKIEILFDFNSKVLHEDEIQLKEELILDIVELEYRNNLLKLLNEGKISVDEFKGYMNELE